MTGTTLPLKLGRKGGIRTHGTLSRSSVFKTEGINRSPTFPYLAPVVGIRPTLTVLETAVLSLYDTDIKFGLPGRIRTDVIPVPKTGAIPD